MYSVTKLKNGKYAIVHDITNQVQGVYPDLFQAMTECRWCNQLARGEQIT